MKVFGIHNTTTTNKGKHQVPKIHMDRSNGVININAKLLSLLGISKRDLAYVLFIEDNKGRIGICRTSDVNKGIPIHWYKSDKRGRIFNSTIVDIIRNKYKIKNDLSHHACFSASPEIIENYSTYIIISVDPYERTFSSLD